MVNNDDDDINNNNNNNKVGNKRFTYDINTSISYSHYPVELCR